jgi:serine/threonine protein phosphatase 1
LLDDPSALMTAIPPAPARVYVIGDIHGRADLLDRVIARITRDLEVAPVADCLTVTLGDYVDRGPDSQRVIERLAGNPFPTAFVALKGNHEAVLERFLVDPSVADHWRRLGGLETLHSYGVDVGPLMRGRGYDAAAAAFRSVLPQAHTEFFCSLKTSLTVGRYFLCHAGVRPGVPLSQQHEDDLLWIRDEFLASDIDFGKIVVHGHSPTRRPQILANRINIDTGAFMSGRLTCAVLEGDRVRLLTVK